MKHIYSLLTALLFTSLVFSQNTFQKKFVGAEIQSKNAVQLLPDSGFIVCAKTSYYQHPFVARCDKNGDTLWSKSFYRTDLSEYIDLQTVIPTSDNGFALIGKTVVDDNFTEDVGCIIKLNEFGDSLWTKFLIDSNPTFGGYNNVSLIGGFEKNGEITTVWNNSGAQHYNTYIVKYDLSGNETNYVNLALLFNGNNSAQNMGVSPIKNSSNFLLYNSYEKEIIKFSNNLDTLSYNKILWDGNEIGITNIEQTLANNLLVQFQIAGEYYLAEMDTNYNFTSDPINFGDRQFGYTELKDETILINTNKFATGLSVGDYVTQWFKIDLLGNVIWSHEINYALDFGFIPETSSHLIATQDTGAIMFSNVFYPYGLFTSKIDKNGEDGDCFQSNPTINLPSPISSFYGKTYPNPTLNFGTHINDTVINIEGVSSNVKVEDVTTLTISFESTDLLCATYYDESNLIGSVSVTATGGHEGFDLYNVGNKFDFDWISLPQRRSDCTSALDSNYIDCLCEGWAVVEVTDSLCLSARDSIYINAPDTIENNLITAPFSCLYDTIAVSSTVTGGTTPYSYNWNVNGQNYNCSGCENFELELQTDTTMVVLIIDDINGCFDFDTTYFTALETPTPPICMVSVDSTSTRNLVVWSKPYSLSIDSFKVYRDVAGVGYTEIAAIPYDSLSQYTDTASGINPNITQYRYKLSAIDSCGNETALSDFHQTIHLNTPQYNGSVVDLVWQAYDGFDYNYFYRILRDTIGNQSWEVIDSVSNTTLVYTDIAPPTDFSNTSYLIEIAFAGTCSATKAANFNSSRSNRPPPIAQTGSAPIANFSQNTQSIEEGQSVNFVDQSLFNPDTWYWEFEGGTPATSTAQNPSITYTIQGVYGVTLTASNALGTNTTSNLNSITVTPQTGVAPTAGLVANFNAIAENGTVSFSDISAGVPTNWQWIFYGGNPTVSTDQNPTNIQYTTAGVYDVQLVVSNNFGTDTILEPNFITVTAGGAAPLADFTSNFTSIIEGASIDFTDLSSNSPSGWLWLLDGANPGSSTQQNPTATYNVPGVYDATLIVTNSFGSDTIVKPNFITVTQDGAIPTADFVANFTNINEEFTVDYTDLSSDNPTSWLWLFSGGSPGSSTDQNPSVTYNVAGSYDTRLIVTNNLGSDTIIRTNYITVNSTIGINYKQQSNTFAKVYPNPNDGTFFLELSSSGEQNVTVNIYTTVGKLLTQESFSHNNAKSVKRLNLQNAANGSYIIEITIGNKTQRELIMIK